MEINQTSKYPDNTIDISDKKFIEIQEILGNYVNELVSILEKKLINDLKIDPQVDFTINLFYIMDLENDEQLIKNFNKLLETNQRFNRLYKILDGIANSKNFLFKAIDYIVIKISKKDILRIEIPDDIYTKMLSYAEYNKINEIIYKLIGLIITLIYLLHSRDYLSEKIQRIIEKENAEHTLLNIAVDVLSKELKSYIENEFV